VARPIGITTQPGEWVYFDCAYPDQTAASWLDGQHRAFVAYGGVPKIADNPKAKPDRYEPNLSVLYADFGRHYGITIIPARVRKPKEKGAVEGAVRVIEMRIMAAARDRVFASLNFLNACLYRTVGGSRLVLSHGSGVSTQSGRAARRTAADSR
jgi:hypothetical protein